MKSGDPSASMALPDPMRGSGRLFMWPSDPATADLVMGIAMHLRRRFERNEAHGCVAVHVDERHAVLILDALRKHLSAESMLTTRAVYKSGLDEPSIADIPRAEPLESFIAFARAKWLGDLITSRRLTAWFQPIVEATQPDNIVAWEALARGLSRNTQVPILPARLLSAARDAGLVAAFDRFVHEQALTGFVFPDTSEVGLFLNVTPRTMEDPNFDLGHLQRTAKDLGVAPSRITLELIESETIADMDRMQDVLTYARGLGFGIALDDLGAGFSNLNLIHRLRPDVVKLDMDLTRNIEADNYKAVLASKVLEATRRLGVRTVAEGVESAAELAWLVDHGVDYVQGFLIARPSPTPAVAPREILSA
ncbi:MAG: EAL domain-containing protein [Myxococcota bacterium]